ncbi:tRNA pseudouridine(38-40) synthase TruA [Catenisphaera adipataccumulans]|jgi:tRNA pseudouridine38-40 synthase|uniref:tRNA pseudouridine synthase A n=1 Tax=Catenisphaera adipataccumulans TaxID=700500 RepID=A0A7W8CYI2_9FIRM|nr:tRNA pseudouridine(38-40) synthase TruA [Catenisphaera adipataccumulans]MBB5183942.1 tRNA pseudouridine38-40 synthase [Catenisphaera adipataccumulans]
MIRLKCTIAYDGSRYAGWQKQINALGIQTVIEQALYKIYGEELTAVSSGRTDAKVHAWGQVFHVDVPKDIAPDHVKQALNALLPEDIRIRKVEIVDEQFHARFSAVRKRYDYLCTFDADDPFAVRYKQILYRELNVQKMIEASQYLIGTHDFTTFASSHIHPLKPRVKTVEQIELVQENKDLRTIFVGNGFLRYQVRMMMQTLIEVGKGHLEPIAVKEMLEAKDKEACRYNAPAQGLYLMRVDYE